jgi:AraC family transcriptional regulator of adaptative response/methylated-DNA-[protein]-cysteine methyltransferase
VVAEVLALLGGRPTVDIPLDLHGTAFERRVWQAIRQIPRGETRSYGEVAAALGQPTAARAVARACAANRVALVVPCHRVTRSDGESGGFRWGAELKRRLVASERP